MIYKKLLPFVVCVFISLQSLSLAAVGQEKYRGKILKFSGNVEVVNARGERRFVKKANEPLHEMDTIVTKKMPALWFDLTTVPYRRWMKKVVYASKKPTGSLTWAAKSISLSKKFSVNRDVSEPVRLLSVCAVPLLSSAKIMSRMGSRWH